VIGKQGLCSGCGNERWLTKPSLMLCAVCNKKRLDKGKEKVKPTGEKIVFEQIWGEREHKSFLSGLPLDAYKGDKWYSLFAHILSKAQNKYPKFKLYKKNIVLLTPDEHRMLDQGTIEEREVYAKEQGCDWDVILELKEELKYEYKAIR
jgi:hypothetical protein